MKKCIWQMTYLWPCQKCQYLKFRQEHNVQFEPMLDLLRLFSQRLYGCCDQPLELSKYFFTLMRSNRNAQNQSKVGPDQTSFYSVFIFSSRQLLNYLLKYFLHLLILFLFDWIMLNSEILWIKQLLIIPWLLKWYR